MESHAVSNRALFLHQGAELYGSDYIFFLTIKALSRHYDIIAVVEGQGPLIEMLAPYCREVHSMPLGVLRRKYLTPVGIFLCSGQLIRAAWNVGCLARRNRVSLVYSNTLGVLAGALAAKVLGIRHIVHVHEIIESPRLIGRILASLAVALSSRVIVVSEAVSKFIRSASMFRASAGQVEVVYNGIPLDPFRGAELGRVRTEFSIPADRFVIAMIGRLHYWKGQDILVEAVALLSKDVVARLRVLMVGNAFPGYEWVEDRLRQRIYELGLGAAISMCGHRTDIPSILADCDLAVVPSTLPDPLPTVVLEAMAAARPVVATRHGGVSEMVVDGETGILVTPTSPTDLAAAIERLASERDLCRAMGNNGRRRVEARFAEADFAARLSNAVIAQG
jgi:glycosyltransferase involved in cell wall biosynthesis